MRFEDKVDEIADHLGEVSEAFRCRRDLLLRMLEEAKQSYDDEILAVEDWAIRSCLIDSDEWRDEAGEPFLPVARVEVLTDPVSDVATMFRERVAELREKQEEEAEP